MDRFRITVPVHQHSLCLETEAKDHHRLLDDVGGDFDSSSGWSS